MTADGQKVDRTIGDAAGGQWSYFPYSDHDRLCYCYTPFYAFREFF